MSETTASQSREKPPATVHAAIRAVTHLLCFFGGGCRSLLGSSMGRFRQGQEPMACKHYTTPATDQM
jgi:hypothetical protein